MNSLYVGTVLSFDDATQDAEVVVHQLQGNEPFVARWYRDHPTSTNTAAPGDRVLVFYNGGNTSSQAYWMTSRNTRSPVSSAEGTTFFTDTGTVLIPVTEPGGILSARTISPTGSTTLYRMSGTTPQALDDSIFYWTFTAPASGAVRLSVDALWGSNADHVVLLASAGVALAGSQRMISPSNSFAMERRYASWVETGLTPGNSYTYNLWQVCPNGNTVQLGMNDQTNGRSNVSMYVEVVPS
jgi:hypothetical protein